MTGVYGMQFLNITDGLGTSNHSSDPKQYWAPNVGGRNAQEDVAPQDRWSVVNFQGKNCIKTTFYQGQYGYVRYGSMWQPNGYRRFGVATSLYIPSSCVLKNSSGQGINGKSFLSLGIGQRDGYNPGADTYEKRHGWNDQVTVPSQMNGMTIGVNMYYHTDGRFDFGSYFHIIGGKGTGGVWRQRNHKFSHLWAIPGYPYNDGVTHKQDTEDLPRDRWFRTELIAQVDDTLFPPNGWVELWIERNGAMRKEMWAYNLDLGGTVYDRRTLGLERRANTAGVEWPALDPNAPVGQLWGANGGGWRGRTALNRDMLGGAYVASRVPASTVWYYAGDSAIYGAN